MTAMLMHGLDLYQEIAGCFGLFMTVLHSKYNPGRSGVIVIFHYEEYEGWKPQAVSLSFYYESIRWGEIVDFRRVSSGFTYNWYQECHFIKKA